MPSPDLPASGPGLLASYEAERRGVAEQTLASAAGNMRALAGALPRDPAVIQHLKRPEFHSPGLVLGNSYAGSPVVGPAARTPWPSWPGTRTVAWRAGDPAGVDLEAAAGRRLLATTPTARS